MRYGLPAVERAMKMQESVLRAMSGTITWLQAADILGLSPRTVRRWRARDERQGDDGLLGRRGRAAAPRPGAPGGVSARCYTSMAVRMPGWPWCRTSARR